MQVFRLVALAGRASLDVVLNHLAKVGVVEITTQPVKGALCAFMAIVVHCSEEFLEERGVGWDVEAPLECHQSISEGPRSHALIGDNFILDCNQRGVLVSGLEEAVHVVKPRSRDGEDRCFLGVMTGQRICHRVGAACLVLNREIKAQQLAHPMVLGNGSQALI